MKSGAIMKRTFLAATAAALLISVPAMAADMLPPPPVPVALYNWTGLYIGGNAGYSVGSEPGSITQTFVLRPPTTIPTTSRTQAGLLAPTGAIGGGQIGYNLQARSNVVLGLEADWQWAGQRDSICAGVGI